MMRSVGLRAKQIDPIRKHQVPAVCQASEKNITDPATIISAAQTSTAV